MGSGQIREAKILQDEYDRLLKKKPALRIVLLFLILLFLIFLVIIFFTIARSTLQSKSPAEIPTVLDVKASRLTPEERRAIVEKTRQDLRQAGVYRPSGDYESGAGTTTLVHKKVTTPHI